MALPHLRDETYIYSQMNLPTREEINVHDSLDERTACEHFLGKTLDEAEELFQENSLYYQEDLMWMGPIAFRFYVQALLNYIQSDSSIGDSDIINCFADFLEYRLEREAAELRPIAENLASVCAYIVHYHAKFELQPEIYGDLRPRFKNLQQLFLRQVERMD